nr:MAG TPA: hypothetical protein [Caudoviricetes sp.]DAL86550.1 MAG TPA: hypothetical protein [Caudoviricetes sp.]
MGLIIRKHGSASSKPAKRNFLLLFRWFSP